MKMQSKLITFFAISAMVVRAQLSSMNQDPSYSCDPNVCKLPSCYCMSRNPPGGLSPSRIPQFITLTFDDSINDVLLPVINGMTSNYTNPNGCPLAATFFVSTQYTNFWHVQQMYARGHEIAVHTMNHVSDPPMAEITGAHDAISAFAGVPANEITGYRQPFLNFTTRTFGFLRDSRRFTYDSSLGANPRTAGFWPYTLDNGPGLTCSATACRRPFSFPGLWEIPLYGLLNTDGSENAIMDPNPVPGGAPGIPTKDEIVQVLKTNFLNRYNSSRLPMGIYLHAAIAVTAEQRVAALREFMDWIRSSGFEDVYWISNQQLLKWMLNPTDVDASLTASSLSCRLPATDPTNVEICDGIDNTGSGVIDRGLVENCYYANEGASFSTCFGCPARVPNITDPVPSRNSARQLVPAAGCPNNQSWDPVRGTCVALKRPQPIPQTKTTPSTPNPTRSPGTSPTVSAAVTDFPVFTSFILPLAMVITGFIVSATMLS